MPNKYAKIAVWFCLLVFGPLQSAQADSPVWKVARGDRHVYIGGTIHVLAKSDYPLPAAFEQVYKQSAKLIFETDIRKLKTPEFQAELLSNVVYSDGRNLKTVLNHAVYRELEQYLSSRGVPIENVITFKPGMMGLTITIIELQRLGQLGTGVDEFFNSRAISDGKGVGQLETVKEQLALISGLGDGYENEFIAHSLRETKILSELMQSLKAAWRQGDGSKLADIVLGPLKKDFPDVYDQVVVKRNNAWIPKIESMLKTEEVEFILVGAIHLVGEDGVLAQLKDRGCDIQQP